MSLNAHTGAENWHTEIASFELQYFSTMAPITIRDRVPGVFDPETDLYIFGTGNPTPGYTGVARPGDNLFTCSLVAVNVTTGEHIVTRKYSRTANWESHVRESGEPEPNPAKEAIIPGTPESAISPIYHRRSWSMTDNTCSLWLARDCLRL